MMHATLLQALVEKRTGMHLSDEAVDRAARARIIALGDGSCRPYVEQVRDDPAELAALIELLVVPETWLFREPNAFAAAAAFACSRQKDANRPLKMLSVPCSTGEEPYSLAMALLDAGMRAEQFEIDGVDISTVALAQARRAHYGRNAFRTADLGFRGRYFTSTDNGDLLSPDVVKLVHFRQGNLLEMQLAEGRQQYDLIFCRNLLIYFEEATQLRALAVLSGLLDDQGMLFSGYAEFPVFARNGFVTAQLPRAFALQKALPERDRPRWTLRAPAPVDQRRPGPPVPPRAVPAAALQPAPTNDADGKASAVDIMLCQARSLAGRGALQDAITQLEACLRLAPDQAEANAMLGAIHLQRRDTTWAEHYFKRALYLEPDRYEVLCQLALLAEQQHDRPRAVALRARAARVLARGKQS